MSNMFFHFTDVNIFRNFEHILCSNKLFIYGTYKVCTSFPTKYKFIIQTTAKRNYSFLIVSL